jgi:hypothetical protein
MAVKSDITTAHMFFAGEDKQLEFEVLDADSLPVDVSGWAIDWLLRQKAEDVETPLIWKTTADGIAVTGTYNAVRATNTQRVVVTLVDTDTERLPGKTYKHALKRTDDGSEAVLAYGDLVLLGSAAH